MSPAPTDGEALLHQIRQQLILSQVRLMELEDLHASSRMTEQRLAETEQLLRSAQQLVDLKIGEAAHLEKIRADLQAQFEHQRHMQHITNEALNATRVELAGVSANLAAAEEKNAGLLENVHRQEHELANLHKALSELSGRTANLQIRLDDSEKLAVTRAQRIQELDRELHAMKSSRSWRWTAWLRAIGHNLAGGKS